MCSCLKENKAMKKNTWRVSFFKKEGFKKRIVLDGGDNSKEQDRQVLNLMKLVVQGKGHKDRCRDHCSGVLPLEREIGINTE